MTARDDACTVRNYAAGVISVIMLCTPYSHARRLPSPALHVICWPCTGSITRRGPAGHDHMHCMQRCSTHHMHACIGTCTGCHVINCKVGRPCASESPDLPLSFVFRFCTGLTQVRKRVEQIKKYQFHGVKSSKSLRLWRCVGPTFKNVRQYHRSMSDKDIQFESGNCKSPRWLERSNDYANFQKRKSQQSEQLQASFIIKLYFQNFGVFGC